MQDISLGKTFVSTEALSQKIQTVLGLINPENLGITLPHEHLIVDGSAWFLEPTEASDRRLAHQGVSVENLWWVRYHWLQNLDDIRLLDEEEAITELEHFKRAGGRAVAEMSNRGFGRDPMALARISRATGIHILMGSGYYLARSMPDEFKGKSEGDIANEIVHDIKVGVGNTGIKSGFIGEIGCSWPLDSMEEKSLRAAVKAQRLTGANLHVHPAPTVQSVYQIVEILEDAKADLARTTIAHMERSVRGPKDRLKLLKKGYTLEYDFFGREGYYPLYLGSVDIPNDNQKINEIIELIEAGFIKQILISQDIWNKHQRRKYGGWGYDHILRNTLPVMRAKGITEEQINTLLVENPRRAFTFV
jgi:phosphotriesterase-related protein